MKLISLLLTLFSVPSIVSGQVSFINQAAQGSFGSQGSVTALKTPLLPSYISSFTPQGDNTYTWSDGVTCWYSSASETFTITATGTYNVTLFADDDDSSTRVETVQATQNSLVLDTRQISNFHGGIYLTYTVTGSVTFKITVNGGANAVLTSVFFDGGTTTSIPIPPSPPCPTPVHSAVIAWQPSTSAGITGYNIYMNGAKIGTTVALTYTVTNLTAGASIVFNVTSVSVSGESAFVTLPAITVPSP